MLSVDISKKLKGFNLDIKFEMDGGVMGLLGASGCGKSLCLKCIAGIIKPDHGRIVLNDMVFFDSEKGINLSIKDRRVGYLFQNYALFNTMTVKKNLEYSVRKEDLSRKNEIVTEVLEKLNLAEHVDKYPRILSGGQKQRVALARILINKPEILMLDEPFSAIDEYLKWQVEFELSRVIEEYSYDVILVSHNRDEIFRLCDKATVVDNGISLATYSMEELFKNPKDLTAALLSGCKDYTKIKRIGDGLYRSLDWNIDIKLDRDINNLSYIGIRRHFISILEEDDGRDNIYKCEIIRIIDNIFSNIYILAPSDKRDFNNLISVEVDKSKGSHYEVGENVYIYFDKEKLILLTR